MDFFFTGVQPWFCYFYFFWKCENEIDEWSLSTATTTTITNYNKQLEHDWNGLDEMLLHDTYIEFLDSGANCTTPPNWYMQLPSFVCSMVQSSSALIFIMLQRFRWYCWHVLVDIIC